MAGHPFADVPRDRPSVEFFPAPARLRPYVSGFNVYGTFGLGDGAVEHYFPGWATVRFNYSASPWRVGHRDQPKVEAPATVLFGPSSRQIEMSLPGDGISLGFGITPLGLWRLLQRPASAVADRIVPLEEVWPDALDLHRDLARHRTCAQAFAWLADAIGARLGPPVADEALIARLMALLVDRHDVTVTQVARQLGHSEDVLRRVALRHFGFPMKLLLRRSRFLKSLTAIYGMPPGAWSQHLDPGYHDQSHFIRDSHDFLGVSPGEFLRQQRPLTDLSLRKRAATIGAPVMALHAPPR